ncbi:MAG: mechanosensitive ion channel family protein [Gammaproteobacteria bacterium]|nr:mechanosensitive ion channel family protein [Gammaproteobacteria bacterium]
MLDELRALHPLLPAVSGVLALLLVAVIADLIVKRVLLAAVRTLAKRTRVTWDDALVEHKVFKRAAQIVPALVILSGIVLVPDLSEEFVRLIRNVASGYLVLMVTLTTTAALAAANAIYETYPVARERPLKGVTQLLQIGVLVIGGVMVVAAVMDRSPLLLLSGLGAMTAILLLVFKDTILGLVASVQLTANDMVRVGDWIEMPQFGADGDVVDVALHTVKVQNWDKTITTIPTHKLIAESFKNWRGMSASGGRRIKRSVHIDQNSIRFLTSAEIDRFKQFALLKDYIPAKEQELRDYNARLEYATEASVNQRRLTNVGTFRAYIRNYLHNHPQIHQTGMTLLVRQLPPGPDGLPIEIYCFTRTTAWVDYEDIQADIFDHLLAIAPEFGLRLYQKPAGADLAALQPSRSTNNE